MQIWLQHLMPQHLLSRMVGRLAECRCLSRLKNGFIRRYIQHYAVKMSDALQPDFTQYASFNEFFIRRLKADARPIVADPNLIACPVDGNISELGRIEKGRLLQAKGVHYDLETLLGGDIEMAKRFHNGHFFTAYLSPKDYHRIHMPISGRLLEMIHVPGRLFSVCPHSVQGVPGLFARNERVISLFDTEIGPMAMIAVGAIIVASIATAWHGVVTPPSGKIIQHWDYGQHDIRLSRGEEMGYFKLGSTVIMLFGPEKVRWFEGLKGGDEIKMGQSVGCRT